ncbi:lipolytic protein G-D-S-L family [Sphingobacteriaceae bacterium GW460-11-11-14-LB5]|nr:lipolytic protein G-D-S-L family [Sphingobacteriaceae bacterium GW460-11-11-14-LB5]
MKRFLLLISILLMNTPLLFAQQKERNLNIVFIGNSITQGVQLANPADAPPAVAVAYLLRQKGINEVKFSNQGHSGYTTLDFLPGAGRTFNQVEEAANAFTNKEALLVFSLKLGTNDSAIQGPHGAPVSPDRYIENVKTIIEKLLADFPKAIVVLQHPIWYSPNTYNSSKYLQEGLSRVQAYIPKIDSLVTSYRLTKPKHVFVGDKKAFAYFKKHHLTELIPEKGQAGTFYLHPNKSGAVSLGEFWGKAIERVVKKNF